MDLSGPQENVDEVSTAPLPIMAVPDGAVSTGEADQGGGAVRTIGVEVATEISNQGADGSGVRVFGEEGCTAGTGNLGDAGKASSPRNESGVRACNVNVNASGVFCHAGLYFC